MKMKDYLLNPDIVRYIEESILPCYDSFDLGHRRDHALNVIDAALYLSSFYDVDRNMVAVAAACHDLGLRYGREDHHLSSGRIIRADERLKEWFSEEQIETIAEAAEDHRASSGHEPRGIYGKITAEADRQIIPETIIRRTIQYGLHNYPQLDKEGHWRRMLEHMAEKYEEGGYLKLWIPQSANAGRLRELREIIKDKALLRKYFDEIFEAESAGLR